MKKSGKSTTANEAALAITSGEMTRERAIEVVSSKLNSEKLSPQELQDLKKALKVLPEVARAAGDMAYQARERVLRSFSLNEAVKDVMRQELENVQEGMGYSQSPTLEKLLIEQIGICWLQMNEMELRYTAIRSDKNTTMSIDQSAWLEKRLTIMQARYLKAIEMLAKVRKLGRPAHAQMVMVNVAEQQINAAITAGVQSTSNSKTEGGTGDVEQNYSTRNKG